MADATKPAASTNELNWGAPVTAVISLSLLCVGMAVAYFSKNENAMMILIGIIGSNATTAVGYYLGSSRSSQMKDQIISNQLPPAPVTAAVITSPVPPGLKP